MSSVTTFGIFKSLLTKAVTADASLDAGTRASMLSRINELARRDHLLLDHSNVESTAGNVAVNAAASAIEVTLGAVGNNRVQWSARSFVVPVDIDGTLGERGFLPGHGGQSALPLIALADISLLYRTSSTGVWQPFVRNTLLREVSWIQFAANIADQLANSALPQVNMILFQV